MANHFFSVNRGPGEDFHQDSVTTGAASTAGDDFEIRIADAAGWTRFEITRVLERFERYFAANGGNLGGSNFPPQ